MHGNGKKVPKFSHSHISQSQWWNCGSTTVMNFLSYQKLYNAIIQKVIIMLKSLIRAFAASVMYWSYHSLALIHQSIGFEWAIHNCYILMGRAGVKYVFEFASTNTNTNTVYLYLHLIKFQTMYLYLYLIHCIWCIWQIRFQIYFFPGLLSKHKFMEHKLTWIFFINMLKSDIFFQNKCRDLFLLIPIGDCVCALDLACQWICDKPLA